MKTILVVDDEQNVQLLYEEELLEEGYHVLTASNGLEALKILDQNQQVDLVLLDIKMPVMDGSEFLSRVRQFNTNLPILLSTAYGDLVQQDFNAWLANGYTMKTSDLSQLKSQVKEILGE